MQICNCRIFADQSNLFKVIICELFLYCFLGRRGRGVTNSSLLLSVSSLSSLRHDPSSTAPDSLLPPPSTTTTTTRRLHSSVTFPVLPFRRLWQLMEVDCDGPSSARRRRERRLRSWWRHERMSVAAALAEAHHHSAPKVGSCTGTTLHGARRPPEQVVSTLGVLKEPEVQLKAATVGYVAAPGPLLEVSSMAGGDSVDGTALWFLVKNATERQKEEEEEGVWSRR